jgi:hypothetical protein
LSLFSFPMEEVAIGIYLLAVLFYESFYSLLFEYLLMHIRSLKIACKNRRNDEHLRINYSEARLYCDF